MGQLIFLMGPTGCGKSTQGDLLAQDINGVHLSSGKLLREDPTTVHLLASGALAPASEVHRVVGEAMAKVPDEVPIVLDGVPRTQADMDWLDENLSKLGRELTRVVVIDFDIESSLKRLSARDRSDDGEAQIRRKYEWYATETGPIIEHYKQLGLMVEVDGRGTIEEVHDLVKAAAL